MPACSSVSLPPVAMGVTLVPVSSASVEIHRPRFRMKDGVLHLEAYALRQYEAETTANTHVDLVYIDTAGRELGSEIVYFNPRSIPKFMRMPHPHAYLLVRVQPPIGTRAVEVRAHDGPHVAPQTE